MIKTLVAGLGNPILGDDGVGWVVADCVTQLLYKSDTQITVENFALSGLSLMEQLLGYDRIVLIDSIQTGHNPVGTVIHFSLDEMTDPTLGHSTSVHDLSLKNALILGRQLNAKLPEDKNITIVAIETKNVNIFSETLSEEVAESVETAVNVVLGMIGS